MLVRDQLSGQHFGGLVHTLVAMQVAPIKANDPEAPSDKKQKKQDAPIHLGDSFAR